MQLISAPWWLRIFFPGGLTWKFETGKREIFLTFDDGPVPEVTPQVLKILDDFDVKATFFCVGENVEKHFQIFELIRQKGHCIGSHTFHHSKAWKLAKNDYLEDVREAARITGSKLFRPPHGQITPGVALALRKEFKIIMWTALSADYDPKISAEQCLQNALKHVKPGAIIVFHDSLKAQGRMLKTLPAFIEHCLAQGYSFSLPPV